MAYSCNQNIWKVKADILKLKIMVLANTQLFIVCFVTVIVPIIH